jgi:hypothetical protein
MAITYGMSVKEFWEEDPDLFWAYRFSYYNKLKEQQEIFNANAWLQGAYFCEGMIVAINNAFNKQKIEYSHQPYSQKKQNKMNIKEQQEIVVSQLRGRVTQVQAIKGKNKQEIIKGESRV